MLALLAAACAAPPPPPLPERPNIVFFFSDDHAAQALGCYDTPYPHVTPRLDALAAEGVVFENCFCANSICAPSRATVLTGAHSHVNGVMQNGPEFDPGLTTFPRLLQEAGYQTAFFGKWHLQSMPQGFDTWEVLPGQGTYYDPEFITPEGKIRREGYVSDLITERALRWLREERDPSRPFLLCVWHKAPHREWLPAPRHMELLEDAVLTPPPTLFDDYADRASPAAVQEMTIARHLIPDYDLKLPPGTQDGVAVSIDWAERHTTQREANMSPAFRAAWDAHYGPRNAAFLANPPQGRDLVLWKWREYLKDYLRCVKGMDEGIGAVLDALDAQGLGGALTVYSSDQGFYLGEHGWFDKRWIYEESLRMPLIVRWRGVIEPGRREARFAQNTDFASTFCALAGAAAPPDAQGTSLTPLLLGTRAPAWRDAIYYRYYEHPGTHNVARHMGVRTKQHKLAYYEETDEWELFDLAADPRELRSVAADPAYVRIFASLRARLRTLADEVGDVLPEGAR